MRGLREIRPGSAYPVGRTDAAKLDRKWHEKCHSRSMPGGRRITVVEDSSGEWGVPAPAPPSLASIPRRQVMSDKNVPAPSDQEAREARARRLREQVKELLEPDNKTSEAGSAAKTISPRDFVHREMAKAKGRASKRRK